jgi:hypothetical protein
MSSPSLKSLALLAAGAVAVALPQMPAPLSAQEGGPAPETVKIDPALAQKVMEELAKLREERENLRQTALQAAIQRIQRALSTETGAVELYQDCIKAESFTGQSESMNSEFRDWKDRTRDQLKSGDFRKCLRVHLQYLALSLEYLALQDNEPQRILPKLASYLAEVETLTIPDRGPARELMFGRDDRNNALSNSVFVKNLSLEGELRKLKDWDGDPGDINGIEEKTILPLLRQHHKDQLVKFWDKKIEREKALAARATLASSASDFANLRLPTLEWKRAQDMLAAGQGQDAYKEMFRIVKSYKGHPEFTAWASALEGYMKASLPAPAKPADATATNPGTDPAANAGS